MNQRVIEEIILWAVLICTVTPCLVLFAEAWHDRPAVMRDPKTWRYITVRKWQREHGYAAR